jgi:hypothetical protein
MSKDGEGDRVAGLFGPGRAELVEVADRDGARLLVGTAHVLAGLLTAGVLEYARGPGRLVEVLCPSVPPGVERDRLVFAAGAAAGLSAGSRRGADRWDPAGLQAAADALGAAGFEVMGALAGRAAAAARTPGVGRPAGGADGGGR